MNWSVSKLERVGGSEWQWVEADEVGELVRVGRN